MIGSANGCNWDERQLAIRGQVYWHALAVAIALLVVNALLQVGGVVWASGYAQNLFIVFVVAAVFAIEAIWRDAFFGRRQRHWAMIWIYGITGVLLISVHIWASTDTTGIYRSDHIVFVATGVSFIAIAIIGAAKELARRREDATDDARASAVTPSDD